MSNKNRNYTVGVLRHAYMDHAEDKIQYNGQEKGLNVVILDPFEITIGANPNQVINHGSMLDCDGIISRAEISSCLAPESEAYLRILQFYECREVPVINSSRSTILCQDKFRTHFTLSSVGIPTPKTFVTYNLENAKRIMEKEKLEFPVIAKNIYGSRGDGVDKVNNIDEMINIFDKKFYEGKNAFMIQEFIPLERNEKNEVKDYRLWVVRDSLTNRAKTLGGVYRNAREGNFKTNVKENGYVTKIEKIPENVAKIGEKTLEAICADVAGVDVGISENGKPYVLEVNISFDSGPRTERFIGHDVWSYVIDLLISRIKIKNHH